jgi:predicted LPLAT superfamily acyltransferase
MSVLPARQYLALCVDRAMVHATAGDYPAAISSFTQDVAQHPRTAWIAAHDLTVPLLLVDCGDPVRFRAALEAFVVTDSRRRSRPTSRHLIGA